jgi:S-formylglutathione hydrolase FrmB
MSTGMNVFLPEMTQWEIGVEALKEEEKVYPVLYLLHGLSDDHTIWQRRTGLERYIRRLPLAVVMPNAHRSFYTDMKQGLPYEAAMTKELIKVSQKFFPLSNKREDRFIGGFSMGGYGAMKIGLKFPELYSKIICFSGVLDLDGWNKKRIAEEGKDWEQEMKLIFGDAVSKNEDPYFLAEQLKKSGRPLPEIQIVVGKKDELYRQNLDFRNYLDKLGIPCDYREVDGGHNWDFVDAEIKKSIDLLI